MDDNDVDENNNNVGADYEGGWNIEEPPINDEPQNEWASPAVDAGWSGQPAEVDAQNQWSPAVSAPQNDWDQGKTDAGASDWATPLQADNNQADNWGNAGGFNNAVESLPPPISNMGVNDGWDRQQQQPPHLCDIQLGGPQNSNPLLDALFVVLAILVLGIVIGRAGI